MPPLKLTDITSSGSTNILNKWADAQTKTAKDTSSQVLALQNEVAKLNATVTANSSSNTTTTATTNQSPSSSGTITIPSISSLAGGGINTYISPVQCSQGDVVSWSFVTTPPNARLTYFSGVKISGSAYFFTFYTLNPSAATTQSAAPFVINYKVN